MITVPTFTATIFVGLRAAYTNEVVSLVPLRNLIQEFCDKVGLCVTVTETEFIYSGGREHGIIVGLINYPRFPRQPEDIVALAIDLGNQLRVAAKQQRVSVLTPETTYLLGEL